MQHPRTPRHFPRMKVRGSRRRELTPRHLLDRHMDTAMPGWERWNDYDDLGDQLEALAAAAVPASASLAQLAQAAEKVGRAFTTSIAWLTEPDPGRDGYLVRLGLDHPPADARCPGAFLWSAFGASYPDTDCVDGVLADADHDHSTLEGIPCPMHQPGAFWKHEYGGTYYQPVCLRCDQGLATGTPILFHEIGYGLRMSARCGACRKPTWITARDASRYGDEIPPYEIPDAA